MAKIDFEWFGQKYIDRIDTTRVNAILTAGLDLAGKSAEQAPIELGDLKGDAGIDDTRLISKGFILVGYSLPYAMRQHEELGYSHPRGGNAKFLETPFRQNIQAYKDFFANEIGRDLT